MIRLLELIYCPQFSQLYSHFQLARRASVSRMLARSFLYLLVLFGKGRAIVYETVYPVHRSDCVTDFDIAQLRLLEVGAVSDWNRSRVQLNSENHTTLRVMESSSAEAADVRDQTTEVMNFGPSALDFWP